MNRKMYVFILVMAAIECIMEGTWGQISVPSFQGFIFQNEFDID